MIVWIVGQNHEKTSTRIRRKIPKSAVPSKCPSGAQVGDRELQATTCCSFVTTELVSL